MRLKVGVTGGATSVVVIEDEAKLSEFISKLVEEKLVKSDLNIKIKVGFPPKLVDMNLEDKLLDLGIRAGDKVIVDCEVDAVKEEKPKKKSKTNTKNNTFIDIPEFRGVCILRKVPDDNSCLFRAISLAVFKNLEEGSQLRSIVSDIIRNDSSGKYSSAILGKPVAEYCDWIIKPTSWGGAIEMDILSNYLDITINSIDVETNRIDSFNPGKDNFIVILYSGIHYDLVCFNDGDDLDDTMQDVSVFNREMELSNEFLSYSLKLSNLLNQSGKYVTNTAKFQVKCNVCKEILIGEKSINEHANLKKHYDFGEV